MGSPETGKNLFYGWLVPMAVDLPDQRGTDDP